VLNHDAHEIRIDAELHAHLQGETARARQVMESALRAVIDAEGIDVSVYDKKVNGG